MLDLQREFGTTVLLTTHYMEEADTLCDRVAMMHRGQIHASGSPKELKGAIGATATLDDVFRAVAQEGLEDDGGSIKDVRATRRTADRVG